jgi:hypothetical protein
MLLPYPYRPTILDAMREPRQMHLQAMMLIKQFWQPSMNFIHLIPQLLTLSPRRTR